MKRNRRPDPTPPDESFEPYEEPRTIPIPVLSIAVALALWGGLTLYQNGQAVGVGQQERADDLAAQPALGTDSGAVLFEARCATCHQPNGVGVRNAVPPLMGSEFVAAAPQVMTQILLHGIDGPISVAGRQFNGHMPSFSSVLPDQEIAAIVNYARNRFGAPHSSQLAIDSDFVAEQRSKYPNRGSWFGGEEIAAVLDTTLPSQPPARSGSIESANPAVLKLINDGRGPAWACSSCHGSEGQGGETVPRLAGLPSGYIAKQLKDYVAGDRHNETMTLVASTLTEDEMTGLGNYYSRLRSPSNAAPSLGGDLERGEQLALEGDWSLDVPGCFSCHGPSGFGVAPGFPSLAAQHPAYTAAQLAAWAGGQRDNAPVALMNHIAIALDDDDRRAVADYLATLPPVPATGGPAGDDEDE
ncbi:MULTISPECIES: c-type cytochrome [Devosia]|uniref:Cytochrome c553 n=1 Tax=Devosia limi DSM 17137 TaxID=1121477 RepID=A0A1M5EPH7_9HYPH|nr:MULTISPECIES: c-type cytochrome [Devosia]MBU1334350.1 c-type cytochrome [Alphaproteobacteria bacterium]MBU1559694.1 c-type cytochrome [Alphaproteobacteria bacterium]MBU2305073.1 c-type cytochrome [Alphaproteobacteria bacterium]MBU2367878.1 c-type cytochrome [Alphaproteobacteria bacterium]SHF81125.1 Cytochrome c553 [Devosia limi DSM 17137]